jgi:hypothetical protein
MLVAAWAMWRRNRPAESSPALRSVGAAAITVTHVHLDPSTIVKVLLAGSADC